MSKLLCKAERRQIKDRFDPDAELHLDSYGLVGNLPIINHNCLNTVFIRSQKKNRLKYSSFWKEKRQTSLIEGIASNNRMTVSFAQGPSASVIKPVREGSWRKTEIVTKGVKKAKSMAFNETSSRLEYKNSQSQI